MSEVAPIKTQKPASSAKMLQAMLGIGILSALLTVTAFQWTLPRVQKLINYKFCADPYCQAKYTTILKYLPIKRH